MGTVWRIVGNRWFKTGLAVIVLMVLVWLVGPLLGIGTAHPLETDVARYIAIGALFVLWLISNSSPKSPPIAGTSALPRRSSSRHPRN